MAWRLTFTPTIAGVTSSATSRSATGFVSDLGSVVSEGCVKLALIALAPLILGACSRESQSPVDPTPDHVRSAPTPPPANPAPATDGWIWAMAVRATDGGCIPGATFTVASGQAYVGEVFTQQTPCSVWDYGDVGVWFRGLTPGVAMTLRASATGYAPVERAVFAQSSGSSEIFAFR
jgi:hypothetical protein